LSLPWVKFTRQVRRQSQRAGGWHADCSKCTPPADRPGQCRTTRTAIFAL